MPASFGSIPSSTSYSISAVALRASGCARDDGSLPVERAVKVLASQCLSQQKMPRDFGVMVATHEDLVSGLVVRATPVIEYCATENLRTPSRLLQDQVLAGILQNLSDKEIAAKLNISERTVKFHVSALLQKFDVRGRADLMLEAVNILPSKLFIGANRRSHATPSRSA